MEDILIKQRCCFTGHRPDKLTQGEKQVTNLLEKAIDQAIADGYVTFVTGMAMGTDVWAAEIVLKKMKKNKKLHLVCAIPHPGFERGRSDAERKRYENILLRADHCVLVCDSYYPSCYQRRNVWMVDRCQRVIAAFNGTSGGTANTIRYAKSRGKEILNIFEF